MSSREKVLFACVVLLSVVVLVLSFSVAFLLTVKITFTQTAAGQTVPAPLFPASPSAPVSPTISVSPSPAASATIPVQILPTLVSTLAFPTAPAIPTPNPSPTPLGTARGRITERVSASGAVITVNQVKESHASDLYQPRSGNTLLLVDVTCENAAFNSNLVCAPDMFHLRDSQGSQYDSTLVMATPELQAVLPPGQHKRGWLTFEIPSEARGLTLVYAFPFLDSPQILIQIDLGR
jgi:hypothetical protein